jgi:hypothetical protein
MDMYKIEKKAFGVFLYFEGFIQAAEMGKWVAESKSFAGSLGSSFGVFVDMRNLKPLPPDSQEVMQEGQKLFKEKGMVRSVVVLDNAITTLQFKRIAKETGIYQWERYIDASQNANWQKVGEDWLISGTDPDK